MEEKKPRSKRPSLHSLLAVFEEDKRTPVQLQDYEKEKDQEKKQNALLRTHSVYIERPHTKASRYRADSLHLTPMRRDRGLILISE